jgi:hypothetical protein
VDFALGDGFIIKKERRVQNADLDTENVITGKRTRRNRSDSKQSLPLTHQ